MISVFIDEVIVFFIGGFANAGKGFSIYRIFDLPNIFLLVLLYHIIISNFIS
jgi:hypothetical protein